MRFGVVIHGPESIDTGLASEVIQLISKEGEIQACVGGATGITAVIDAGLEQVIDISRRELPSEALSRLDPIADCLLLVTCGKTEETGIEFGRIVFLRSNASKPLVQVDCKFVVGWGEKSANETRWLAKKLSKKIVNVGQKEERMKRRKLAGVLKGENVLINGVVVGKALTDDVEIWKDDNGKLCFSGIGIKKNSLDRIGDIELTNAIIRSGITRRTYREPRSVYTLKKPVACIIDHDAERMAHELKYASVVISIGDDTTKNTGGILRRYGVPIIGITDDDEDGICTSEEFTPGSVIFVLERGNDDYAGMVIREQIFNGKSEIPFKKIEFLLFQITKLINKKIKSIKKC